MEVLQGDLKKHQHQLEAATQQSSAKEEKLLSELSSLQAAKAEVEQKLSELDDQHFVEVNALQKKLRSAEKRQHRTEEEWRTKLEEMLYTLNTEKTQLVEDHHNEMKQCLEKEATLTARLQELSIQTEQLQQQLAVAEKESTGEKQHRDSRISELESLVSITQEKNEQSIASVKKKAESQLRTAMENYQAALQEKEVEMQQRLAEQRQQILEESAKMATRSEELLSTQREELTLAEQQHSSSMASMKKALNAAKSETQAARDKALAEGEKMKKLKDQLIQLQRGHEVEMEAVRGQVESEERLHANRQWEELKERLVADHNREMERLREEHTAELRRLENAANTSSESRESVSR